LPSDDQHLTKWLLLAGVYSGAPEIACTLMRKLFQPHTQGVPLQRESDELFVRVTDRFLLPPGHPLMPSQTLTLSVLEKFRSSGTIA